VLGLLVAAIAAAFFVPALAGGWIYDDHALIPNNPYIHSFEWWPRWFVTDFWDVNEEKVRFGTRIVYWRPLITASYAVDWRLGGGSPLLFHITNTLAHAVVAGLAFVTLRRWIGAAVPACIAALLFAVHPTKAESVAWIAGRTDVFCMIAIFVAVYGLARRLSGQRGGLALEVFGTAAAYMTKEQAIVLPAFVAVEAWVRAGRPSIDLRVIVGLVRVALPQAIIAIAYFGLRAVLLPIRAAGVDNQIGAANHAQAILETFGRFITLTFAPHELSIQQGLINIQNGESIHSVPYMIIGAVGIAAGVGTAILARRRLPFLTIGIGFFFVTLLPTANIVYTDMVTLVSERFLYLPILGIAFAVGASLARYPVRWAYVVAIVAILVTGAQAIRRAHDYRDEQAFWARELALHPQSPMAQQFAITEAMRVKHYEKALAQTLELSKTHVRYEDATVASQLAQLLALLVPDHDEASLRAIDAFCGELLESKPPAASINVRNVSFSIPTQNKAYARKIDGLRLGIVATQADIRSRLGDDAGAVALAEQQFALCPRCPTAVMMAALALARAGDYERSLAVLDSARELGVNDLLAVIRSMVERGRAAYQEGLVATGPAKLRARASELAALELWGRAYDVLAPYKAEIMRAPKSVVGFAELAFRAGEPGVAREVLGVVDSPEAIENRLAGWARTMGWTE
jgi:protein O-mannosyl-transferase